MPRIVVLHDPLSAEEHLRLGALYEARGQVNLAEKEYAAVLQRDARSADPLSDRQAGRMPARRAEAHTRLGNLAYQRGEPATAGRHYLDALAHRPDHPEACNNLAWIYAEQGGGLEEAEALARRAVQASTGSQRAYFLDTLGVVLLRRGHPQEAHEVFVEALALAEPGGGRLRAALQRHLEEAVEALSAGK
ncbi:MAG: tetratricopeptide repeat protein [Nitrospirae bacterium]|nr:tetratricopeptide repeat protein [Nitrospirota bacterium]